MTSISNVDRRPAAPALGTFERYLTLWVALCILAGIVLGRWMPGPFQLLGRMTVAEVNIPVAVLIWLMIVPMLLKIDLAALGWPALTIDANGLSIAATCTVAGTVHLGALVGAGLTAQVKLTVPLNPFEEVAESV